MSIKCLFGFHKEQEVITPRYEHVLRMHGKRRVRMRYVRAIRCSRCGKVLGQWFADGRPNDYSREARRCMK